VFTYEFRCTIITPLKQTTRSEIIMRLEQNDFFQTTSRGTNDSEYQLYLDLAIDAKGIDFTTGKPAKTYDEWMNS
jgi:hypothetical protein